MTPAPITLELPMPPRLTNSSAGRSRHWRSLWREKQEYYGRLNLMQAAGVFPKPPNPTPALTSMHVRMHLGGRMDHDGAMARMKWPLDWLVANRYLVDDNHKHLQWEGFPEQHIKRDGNYRIVIVLTPAA